MCETKNARTVISAEATTAMRFMRRVAQRWRATVNNTTYGNTGDIGQPFDVREYKRRKIDQAASDRPFGEIQIKRIAQYAFGKHKQSKIKISRLRTARFSA